MREHSPDFVHTQDHWHANLRLRVRCMLNRPNVSPQHVSVEEHDGAERLILRRRGHPLLHGKPGQKRGDLRRAELARMTFAVKYDLPAYPMNVRILGSPAVMTCANFRADALHQSRSLERLHRLLTFL
jgi:hypothetical protein